MIKKVKSKKGKDEIASFVRVPDFGDVDVYAIEKHLGVIDYNFERIHLSKAIEIVLDAIFEKYARGRYKKQSYKSHEHSIKYEFKKYECYLAVYVQDATITYTVRVQTVNSNPRETLRVVYYSSKYMACYPDSLLKWVLRDFSRLVYEAVNLEYAFEHAFDGLPSGVCRERNGHIVPFFYLHEDILMTPIHYYDSVGYPHKGDECTLCPFEEWFPDLNEE